MRRSISTAVTLLVAGLSVPVLGSAAHAAAPALAVTASCSITTPHGDCYQAGEFCSRAELGKSTTAVDGEAIHCVLDGQYRRWLGTGSSSSGGTSGGTAAGQGGTGTGGTTQVVPLGGVAAGGGGLATVAERQAVAAPQADTALPAGLAAGALAAGVGGVLVVRRRRAADGR